MPKINDKVYLPACYVTFNMLMDESKGVIYVYGYYTLVDVNINWLIVLLYAIFNNDRIPLDQSFQLCIKIYVNTRNMIYMYAFL